MNVLPSSTLGDMHALVDLVLELGASPAQLRMAGKGKEGRVVLSTFGGGEVSFGGVGWEGFLGACRRTGMEVGVVSSFSFWQFSSVVGLRRYDTR